MASSTRRPVSGQVPQFTFVALRGSLTRTPIGGDDPSPGWRKMGDMAEAATSGEGFDTRTLDRDALADAVGTVVTAETPSGEVSLHLHDVTASQVAGPYESFSVYLLGPADRLEQATYPMTHPVLGRFDLFIVPVAAEEGGILYEAAFNRIVPEAT
jgi:hypothetical protein